MHPLSALDRMARRRRDRVERAAWAAAGLELGPGARLAAGSVVGARLRLGAYAAVNGPADFRGPGAVTIGPYSAIGHRLTVLTGEHRTDHANVQVSLHRRHGFLDLQTVQDTAIGPACWVGDGVTVLAGAQVGAGAVLAAGAVVRGAVEPYTIVGGVAARLLRRRCPPEVAELLVRLAWWDWPEERIARNRAFFDASIAELSAAELEALVVA